MANLPTSLATTGVAGAIAGITLKYFAFKGVMLDEDTAGAVVTLTIAGCHGVVEAWNYLSAWLPKPPTAPLAAASIPPQEGQ
jgi:hypothetical protein